METLFRRISRHASYYGIWVYFFLEIFVPFLILNIAIIGIDITKEGKKWM